MDVFKDFARSFATGEDEEQADPVQQVVSQHTAPQPIEEDEELLEIDKCLSKAVYYKVIVRDGVLEEDGSAEVAEINAEVRTWARQQMAKLVGRGPTAAPAPVAAPSPFSEPQTAILREIADRVLASKGVSATPQQPAPAVKRLQAPSAPPQPQRRPAAPPPKPAPAKPAQKPPVAPQKKPGQQQKKPQPKKSLYQTTRDANGKIEYSKIPMEEIFRDDDGQLYRYVPHPDKDNTRVKQKVTGQIRTREAVPFPTTKVGMSAMTEAQSRASLDSGASANTIFPDEKGGADVFIVAAANALKDNKEQ